jgi:Co/Zn/Cd efflux system component
MFIMPSIAAQMFVVGVVGTVSNVIGAALFKYARTLAPKKE